MRITGGSWRGRRLGVPPGRDVRPTSDRVRESLFSILQHNDFGRAAGPVLTGGLADGPPCTSHVLDTCAGTGTLGIEALSRGAAHAFFFDVTNTALDCVRENLVLLGAGPRATVRRTDTTTPPPAKPGEACDLVFLDPPYASDVAERALPALAGRGWFAKDAIIVIEHGDATAPEAPAGFIEADRRTYGTTSLLILRHTG
jgi:16S rRNA (guanine966-N2)-methyltransferase